MALNTTCILSFLKELATHCCTSFSIWAPTVLHTAPSASKAKHKTVDNLNETTVYGHICHIWRYNIFIYTKKRAGLRSMLFDKHRDENAKFNVFGQTLFKKIKCHNPLFLNLRISILCSAEFCHTDSARFDIPQLACLTQCMCYWGQSVPDASQQLCCHAEDLSIFAISLSERITPINNKCYLYCILT